MASMKIVFVNSFYFPDEVGGAERSVRFLAESLVSEGHEVTVVCTGKATQRELINGVVVERVSIPNIYFPLDGKKRGSGKKFLWHFIDSYNPRAVDIMRELLERVRPDLIHSNTLAGFSVSAWSAAKIMNIPVVHTLRDYYLLCPNTAMFKSGKPCEDRCRSCRLLGFSRFRMTKVVDVVVGNSEFILKRHTSEGLFSRSKACVIYNAYKPKNAALDLREPGVITFGFIGRLAPTKGLDVLLKAFRAASAFDGSSIRLVVAGVGDAEYVESLRLSATGLSVEFLGQVEQQDFFPRLDWCVVPSLWDEPLARVLFESFAHGVPVIGSNTGGTPELVVEGENGYIYPAHDVDALTRAILKGREVARSEWGKMSARCRAEAARFVPENVVAQYLDAYRLASMR